MIAPITFVPDFCTDPDAIFARLWAELPWERRSDAPRRECWMTDLGLPYVYGRGAGKRMYFPVPWHRMVLRCRSMLRNIANVSYEGCFINGYEGPRDHLGWHADDSLEIDATRPIAIVSFGATRRIMFRSIGGDVAEECLLTPGSLLLMHAGMQQTHEHRIPKHAMQCSARISLTYRGLISGLQPVDDDA